MFNIPLVTSVIAWAVAQTMKTVISLIKLRRFDFEQFWASGGMPSSHSSTVTALSTACGYMYGFDSGLFAIACVLSLIVMYDAAGVRRAAGEQAKVLNRIVNDIQHGETRYLEKNLKELIGHTPLQVFIGALFGLAIPFLIPIF